MNTTHQAAPDMAPRGTALPSSARLLSLVVLLPTGVAATNYVLLFGVHSSVARVYFYPGLVLSTALLSWSVGRYLWPTWLQWLVFAWALVLLDLLTFTACLGGPVNRSFGYILVSAQIAFLTLWALLGHQPWQLRLPIVVVAAALVMGFSGSFDNSWSSGAWNLMMLLTAVQVAAICGGLRWLGFSLRPAIHLASAQSGRPGGIVYQFGTRHMLIWATAVAPLLVVVRGLNPVFVNDAYDARTIFVALSLVVALSSVCLIAIWAVLGDGRIGYRMAALLLIPAALGVVMQLESRFVANRGNRWQSRILAGLDSVGDEWIAWFGLTAALLAALLLFLRAKGVVLVRQAPAE